MQSKRSIHFGHFLFWYRTENALKRGAVAKTAGIAYRTLERIEKDVATPDGIQVSTLGGLAKALGLSLDELQTRWKKTPVAAPTVRKAGDTATGRLAGKYGVARAAAVLAVMGWLERQPEATQREALGLSKGKR